MEFKIRTKNFLMLMIILSLHDCGAVDEVKKLSNDSIQFKKMLKIGVSVFSGFPELLNKESDSLSDKSNFSGFCIDVFMAAIERLPYAVAYEFIPFSGTYNDLLYQVHLQKFDAAVGDITITANRSLYVDFTLPFTDPGLGIVGVKQNDKSKWIFLKPLTADLWLAIAGLFFLTGLVVWIIERPRSDEFQGSLSQQIGTACWFSLSTLVFADGGRLLSNLSRFVVMIWVFVALVLTSSYTATLTSMLTVQQIEASARNNYIGYPSESVSRGELADCLNFESTRLKPLNSAKEYAEALSKGSKHGGVSAIIDEMPYIKLFLARYGNRYSMIHPPISTTSGFGFAFPKGSQMAQNISWALAILREEGELFALENAKLNSQKDEIFGDTADSNAIPLTIDRFQALFLISGFSSVIALSIFAVFVLRSKWHVVAKYYEHLVGQKLYSLRRFTSEYTITRSRGESRVVDTA